MPPLSRSVIAAAILGFEQQKSQIDTQIADLRAMLSDNSGRTAAAKSEALPAKRRKMSPAARKRIAEGVRARWAKLRGEAEKPAASAPKAKRKLSAAAKAKLVANLKKARAAKAKLAAAKKAAPVKKKAATKATPEPVVTAS